MQFFRKLLSFYKEPHLRYLLFEFLKMDSYQAVNEKLRNKNRGMAKKTIIFKTVYLFIDNTLFIAAIFLLSTLYYFTIILFAVIYRVAYYKKFGDTENQDKNHYSEFVHHLEEYYLVPTLLLHRVLEGHNFSRADFSNPAVEIGCYDGVATQLYFPGKRFVIGTEYSMYVFDSMHSKNMWDNKVFSDVRYIPFKDKSFSSVVSVHVLDHVFELDSAISEISRILRKGGKFIFSTYSENFLYATPYSYIFNILGMRETAQMAGMNYAKVVNFYNFYSLHEWEIIFKKHGMRLVSYRRFHSLHFTGLYIFLHYLLYLRKAVALLVFIDKIKFIGNIQRYIFKWASFCLIYPIYIGEIKNECNDGINLFFTAEKEI